MSLEVGIWNRLIHDVELRALMGERVFAVIMPQEVTLPAMAYRVVSTADHATQDGTCEGQNPRFQFDYISLDFPELVSIRDTLRKALQGYRATIGGVKVVGIQHANSWYTFDENSEYFRGVSDYEIWHQ